MCNYLDIYSYTLYIVVMMIEKNTAGENKMTKRDIEFKLNHSSADCLAHSKTCRECYMPIMDEEGNPQYVSEACQEGAKLLIEYNKLESMYWNL